MPTREARRRHVEEAGLWIARLRLVVVLFAVAEVGFRHDDYPSGYETRGRPCLRDRPAVDALEAANRCARTLASSLDVSQAFGAFIRELRGLVEFDRVAIVGKLVYRPDMEPTGYPEERELLGLGLRSRVLAPLQVGPRTIGMLGLVRADTGAFAPEEVELVALLGRLVATAAQNIRAYEAEDETSLLASLVADVLDTSRIEAGTFTFTSGTSTWHSSCATSQPRRTWLRARCASGRGERDAAACARRP
jgi:hypothetical protein